MSKNSNSYSSTLSKLLNIIDAVENYINKVFATNRNALIVLVSLLVVAWQWPLLFSGNKLAYGDFDYFTQAYEAVRKSVLEFHQFPWYNSWVGGGVPLYANPQIGVISIQTLMVLMFGAPIGLKISIVIYSLIGYWSMFFLLKHVIKLQVVLALPLALLWITNGFFIGHLIQHYSFSLFLIFPLLAYLVINCTKKLYWLYLGLSLGLFILSAFHYAAFHGFIVLGFIAMITLYTNRKFLTKYLAAYLKAMIVFVLLAGHRMLYSFQYASDFPRLFTDIPNKLSTTFLSFVLPPHTNKWIYGIVKPNHESHSWMEHSAFIGYVMTAVILFLLLLCTYKACTYIYPPNKKRFTEFTNSQWFNPALFGIVFILFVVISMGNFSSLSPYGLLQNIPMFKGMRVPSRWLIWAVFSGLIFTGLAVKAVDDQRLRRILVLLIFLGAAEVYVAGFGNDKFSNPAVIYRKTGNFEQIEDFDRYKLPYNFDHYTVRDNFDRRSENYSYEATLNNFGQTRGYEPLVDTYYEPTNRCSVTKGCSFIKSGNAEIIYWSPNKIVLKRTGEGVVELNMNPSNYWLINGERLYGSQRTVEVLQNFIIDDRSSSLTLEIKPKDPVNIVTAKLKNSF